MPSTSQAYRAYSARPFRREERGQVEILFGGLHWRAEKVIQASMANLGYRFRPLPTATKDDLLLGRELADIGQCCPTSFITGNLANFLKGEASRIGPRRPRTNTSISPPARAAPAGSASITRATSWRCATSDLKVFVCS